MLLKGGLQRHEGVKAFASGPSAAKAASFVGAFFGTAETVLSRITPRRHLCRDDFLESFKG